MRALKRKSIITFFFVVTFNRFDRKYAKNNLMFLQVRFIVQNILFFKKLTFYETIFLQRLI
ncbi:hypothetical protein BTTAP_70129 [Brochothrix thermosphacta]|uniref:Uncharacterized protein n=1 Tax=Brochothrix thermosphacta TaxID=2756 RepID=A0A2X0QQ32_BROTH|nr:hypothetical protein BTBSAS_60126 [Brochothrix thermosphacta]SPP30404.1 hypothetical protein BTTAP_70129 [Brochothrix thermosphacta]